MIFTLVCLGYFCYAAGLFLDECRQKLLSTKVRVEQTDTIKVRVKQTDTIIVRVKQTDTTIVKVEQTVSLIC